MQEDEQEEEHNKTCEYPWQVTSRAADGWRKEVAMDYQCGGFLVEECQLPIKAPFSGINIPIMPSDKVLSSG